MADEVTRAVIIIDNGSTLCRAGLAGGEGPTFVFPSVVGHPRVKKHDEREYYIGNEVHDHWRHVTRKYPVEYRVVINWDDMEKIWHHAFYDELKIDPQEHPVVLTEPVVINSRPNKEKMVEVMFETFGVPSLLIGTQSVFSLYSAAERKTGLVVEFGECRCHIVPIYEGHYLRHVTMRYDVAGRDITDFLMKILNEKNENMFTTVEDRELVQSIKEKLCYVALDYDLEQNQDSLEKSYPVSSGKLLTLSKERIKAPEILFKPELCGTELPGIDWFVQRSIEKCDSDIHAELYDNIVIAGGTSTLPGLPERLTKDVKALAGDSFHVSVTAGRQHASWYGASKTALLPGFDESCITSADYDEYGPLLSHKKFIY